MLLPIVFAVGDQFFYFFVFVEAEVEQAVCLFAGDPALICKDELSVMLFGAVPRVYDLEPALSVKLCFGVF